LQESEKYVEMKIDAVNELNDKIFALESNDASKILEKIKVIMKHKGFLSDQEFNNVMSENS